VRRGAQKIRMSKIFHTNLFNIIASLIIIINIAFLIMNYSISRRNRTAKLQLENTAEKAAINNVDFDIELYNTPCPEIKLTSIMGKTIDLTDYVGKVLVLKFSRFFKINLPDLVYLDHLVGKYREHGVSLFLINSRGKHNIDDVNTFYRFSLPIFEDNGSISGLFNAGSEAIVIVDRRFTIKLKMDISKNSNKTLIYNEIMRWTFEDTPQPKDLSSDELSQSLNSVSFYDVFRKEDSELGILIAKKKAIVTIITSTCTTCEEMSRIQLLKNISLEIDSRDHDVVILFGIGNNPQSIEQFALLNDWNKYRITVGVINKLDENQINIYFDLLKLNIDPRTFILNRRGKVVFAENIGNSDQIESSFIR
jgi:peroxiredoxin